MITDINLRKHVKILIPTGVNSEKSDYDETVLRDTSQDLFFFFFDKVFVLQDMTWLMFEHSNSLLLSVFLIFQNCIIVILCQISRTN